MSDDYKSLEKRLADLEQKVNSGSSKSPKEKKTREPSEYNKFMKEHLAKLREKHPNKSHKDLFTEAANAWSKEKGK